VVTKAQTILLQSFPAVVKHRLLFYIVDRKVIACVRYPCAHHVFAPKSFALPITESDVRQLLKICSYTYHFQIVFVEKFFECSAVSHSVATLYFFYVPAFYFGKRARTSVFKLGYGDCIIQARSLARAALETKGKIHLPVKQFVRQWVVFLIR
jgi:hypothetical protein